MCLALLQTYTRAWLEERTPRQSAKSTAPVAQPPSELVRQSHKKAAGYGRRVPAGQHRA